MKNLFSFLALALFFVMAAASSKRPLTCGYFSDDIGKKEELRNFVEMMDGSRVYGKDVRWKSGLLVKDEVILDGEHFKLSGVRGYQSKGIYYIRERNDFLKRVVHGKLNVYEHTYTTTQSTGRMTTTKINCAYYTQQGDKGPLKLMRNSDDIRDAVGTCPAAMAKLDLKDRFLRRAIRSNFSYLNEVFEIYNNGCKEVQR
jgi:hypothetical protein